MTKKIYDCFLKFGEYKHMKEFYENGHLYCNTFQYFKNLELKSDGRGDKNEYATLHYGGSGIKNIIINVSDSPDMKNSIPMKGGIDFKAITIDTGKNKEYTHLYSLTCIDVEWAKQNNKIIDERNFAENKDYVVLIHNVKEFETRLEKGIAKLNIHAGIGYVEYVDKFSYDGNIGPLRKFNDYSYQNECRVLLDFNSLEPKSIYLGSLSDIAWEPLTKNEFYKRKFIIK